MRLLQGAAVLALALAAAVPAIAAEPANPVPATAPLPAESLTLARQIWDVALPREQRLAMFAKVSRTIADQVMPSALSGITDPELRAAIESKVSTVPARIMPIMEKHLPAMMESYARAYAREFTGDELRQILAFARTPAGTRYLSRSTAVLEDPDVGAANRAYFADAQVIQKELMQEIVAIATEHQARAEKKLGSGQ